MFTVPRMNLIESDDGFSVEVIGRGQLVYREGDRQLNIESERMSAGPVFLVVYARSVRNWAPPYDHEMLDKATKRRVLMNIYNAFGSQNLVIEIEPPLWATPDAGIADGDATEWVIKVPKS